MNSKLGVVLLVAGMAASIHGGIHHLEGHDEHHATSHQNTKLESNEHDHEHKEEHHAHPKYKFDYGVQDHHTGDFKSQSEHRDGDIVHGSYTFLEADGTTRVVDYHADKHTGFNAIVKRIGKAHHPATYHHEHHGQEDTHNHDHHETHHELIHDNVHEEQLEDHHENPEEEHQVHLEHQQSLHGGF